MHKSRNNGEGVLRTGIRFFGEGPAVAIEQHGHHVGGPGLADRQDRGAGLGRGPVVGLGDGLGQLLLGHRRPALDLELGRPVHELALGVAFDVDAAGGGAALAPAGVGIGGPVIGGAGGVLGLPVVPNLLVGVLEGAEGGAVGPLTLPVAVDRAVVDFAPGSLGLVA